MIPDLPSSVWLFRSYFNTTSVIGAGVTTEQVKKQTGDIYQKGLSK